jgi:hypothetical protein
MDSACSTHGEMISAYKIIVGKPKGKRPLGKISRRSEDNIKIDLKEILYEVVDWTYLVQDKDRLRAFVNKIMNLRVPKRQEFSSYQRVSLVR